MREQGMPPEEQAEQLLERLASLRRQVLREPFYQIPPEGAPLAEALRDIARLIIETARRGQAVGPEACRLLRRMFQLGVFDTPPLSGLPYEAWRLIGAGGPDGRGKARPCSKGISAPDSGPCHGAPSEFSPLFSLLLPVYNVDPGYLEAAFRSIRAQTWTDWECCVSDDASTHPGVRDVLLRYAAEDARIRVTFRPVNGHISAATNTALDMARGEWCALVDHDDLLDPAALECMARAVREHPEASVFFSDEDQVLEKSGRLYYLSPLFKPGLDPDLLLACNVVSHFGVYRTTVLRQLGGFRPGLEGAQDHDLALRCLAPLGAAAFVHVPQVLYHWRQHEGSTSVNWEVKPYTREAARRARVDFAKAADLRAEFVCLPQRLLAGVRFDPPSPSPLLTLCLLAETEEDLVPPQTLRRIAETCGYPKCEMVLALPESLSASVRARAMARALTQGKGRMVWTAEKEAWTLTGAAADVARGKALAFVRLPDIPVTEGWAARAVGALWRPDVAAVGCRSVDEEGFLVQTGYAAGQTEEGAPLLCPAYAGLHVKADGYFAFAHLLHSVPAVDLAGMVCRRELFARLGGLDPRAGALGDADFCLRAWKESGLRSVILPDADFVTRRRKTPLPLEGVMRERWADLWNGRGHGGIPFQSPALWWTPGGWRLRALREGDFLSAASS